VSEIVGEYEMSGSAKRLIRHRLRKGINKIPLRLLRDRNYP
jgi:hypothetical protein